MTERPGGDLARMLDLGETIKEKWPRLRERHFCAQPMKLNMDVENWAHLKDTEPFMKGCADAKLRALVFRDSFFILPEPFFFRKLSTGCLFMARLRSENRRALDQLLSPATGHRRKKGTIIFQGYSGQRNRALKNPDSSGFGLRS